MRTDLVDLIQACTIITPEHDNSKSIDKAVEEAEVILSKLEDYKDRYRELKEELKDSLDKSEVTSYVDAVEDAVSDLEYRIRELKSLL